MITMEDSNESDTVEDSNERNTRRQWEAIKAKAPKRPSSAPSPAQLQLLQSHKQRKQNFFAKLTPEQKAVVHGFIREENARSKSSRAQQKKERVRIERSKKKAQDQIVMTPKSGTPGVHRLERREARFLPRHTVLLPHAAIGQSERRGP